MVKGISRQVILVHAPDKKLFDQAIFILNEQAASQGVTEDALLREAEHVIRGGSREKKRNILAYGAFWAALGAVISSAIWVLAVLL